MGIAGECCCNYFPSLPSLHQSRELKRLSTVTLSPIYAHFQESLVGLCTIRALRASQRFISENEARVDVNQRANFGSELTLVFI